MSEPVLAQNTFLSWMRRGAAASLTNMDTPGGSLPFRGQIVASVEVTASLAGKDLQPQPQPVTHPIALYGPGDVIGIDPRHIIRTEPAHLTANFEPNYFAGIEFDHPDFPWLFTPAAPNAGRLRPWFSLIVLAPGEYEESAQAPAPLPSITVKSTDYLPDLSESFAWAHAQVIGGSVQDIASNPGTALSRLLCPRHLQPDTAYTAFLVPAFDLGVLAGLGQPVPNDPGTQIKPAWTKQLSSSTSVTLPVYYRFEFHTSDKGDFESLVRQLRFVKLPKEVGIRLMDVDHIGWNSVPGAGVPIVMGGALFAPQYSGQKSGQENGPPWDGQGKKDFQKALEDLLNMTSPAMDDPQNPVNPHDDPPVLPPFYGRWHAAVQQLPLSNTSWISELNLDPRNRAAAGLGTQIIHEELTQLLASAWRQLGSIKPANQKLRQAQMARGALLQIHAQHFQAAQTETLLSLTTTVHRRMLISPAAAFASLIKRAQPGNLTIQAAITQSHLPQRALSAPFRSITAPRRQLRVRQLLATPPIQIEAPVQEVPSMLTRLNSGKIAPSPELYIPSKLHDPYGMEPLDTISPNAITFKQITPDAIHGEPPQPFFSIQPPGQFPIVYIPFPSTARRVIPPSDTPDAASFRTAATAAASKLQALPTDPSQPSPANLGGMQDVILKTLRPDITVPARLAALIQAPPPVSAPPGPELIIKSILSALLPTASTQLAPPDPLDQKMIAPTFPQPMYEPLRDLSQDYLLPGVENVDPNTVGLVTADHGFIEAYMVGLNHEMARQLLWNGFPTDQRGTYFRQFWDVRSYVPTQDELHEPPEQFSESLNDIPPIRPDQVNHKWIPEDLPGIPSNALGDNENRMGIVENNVVLVVRGELLRRYPHANIYACKAIWDTTTNSHKLGTEEMHILYRGTLSPDLVFFGFNMTQETARGSQTVKDPGWFFVFQQQPGAPRFGLEPAPDPFNVPSVSTWNDLSWANFATTGEQSNLQFAPINKQPQGVAITGKHPNEDDLKNSWSVNAAQTAYITYRRPVRIAVHAEVMLHNKS